MNDYIFRIDGALYNEETGEAVMKPELVGELIRCKDCKHGSPNGKYGCKCFHYRLYETHVMKPEDFCSYAERRTDADMRGEQDAEAQN